MFDNIYENNAVYDVAINTNQFKALYAASSPNGSRKRPASDDFLDIIGKFKKGVFKNRNKSPTLFVSSPEARPSNPVTFPCRSFLLQPITADDGAVVEALQGACLNLNSSPRPVHLYSDNLNSPIGVFCDSIPSGNVLEPLFSIPANLLSDIDASQTHNWLRASMELAYESNPTVRMLSELSIVELEDSNNSHPLFLRLDIFLALLPDFFGISFNTEFSSPSRIILLHALFPPDNENKKSIDRIKQQSGATYNRDSTIGYFYECLRPAPYEYSANNYKKLSYITPRGLTSKLLPFQSRTVHWMLHQEGVMIQKTGNHRKVVPLPAKNLRELRRSPLWQQVNLLDYKSDRVKEEGSDNESRLWLNRVAGIVSYVDPVDELDAMSGENLKSIKTNVEDDITETFRGAGICADEMGLGKTLAVLSLILTHKEKHRGSRPSYYDENLASNVKPTSLTLIVVPISLHKQWVSEISRHAPGLRVLNYEGIKRHSTECTPKYVDQNYDIILTTYDIIKSEVQFARKPHQRQLRGGIVTARYRRSLLIQIDFLRVIIDEVQMLSSSHAATETASLIHRQHSFAVSGTPVKANIKDLYPLLGFLRIFPIGYSWKAFQRFLNPSNISLFIKLFQSISCRSTKSSVQNEIVLPEQNRFLVPVEFSHIERFNYQTRYQDCLNNLDIASFHSEMEWAESDVRNLSRWLTTLRQLCCHPQVGEANRKTMGKSLKNLDEVLEKMVFNNFHSLILDERAYLDAEVQLGNLVAYDEEDCERFEKALEHLNVALLGIESVQKDIQKTYQKYKDQRKQIRDSREDSMSESEDEDDIMSITNNFLEKKEKFASEMDAEIGKKMLLLSRTMHELFILQHSSFFFKGNCYFNMGKFEKLELEAYAKAEEVRHAILSSSEKSVNRALASTKEKLFKNADFDIQDLEVSMNATKPGISSHILIEMVIELSDRMNQVAELLWEWRANIIEAILKPVLKDDEEAADGEEYLRDAELQESVDIRIEAYEKLFADWREYLIGNRSDFITTAGGGHDIKRSAFDEILDPSQKRKSRKASEELDTDTSPPREIYVAKDPSNEGQLLRAKLSEIRATVSVPFPRSLQGLSKDLFDSIETLRQEDADIEKEIIKTERSRINTIIKEKDKVFRKLFQELSYIRSGYNSRVVYFKQLQTLSDLVKVIDVNDPEFTGIASTMKTLKLKQKYLTTTSIDVKKRKRAYLEYLQNDDQLDEGAFEECMICSDSFTRGTLILCGHMFCSKCFHTWMSRSKSCPVCKCTIVGSNSYRAVTLTNVQKVQKKGSEDSGRPPPSPLKDRIAKNDEWANLKHLRLISEDYLSEIDSLDIGEESFGSKIDIIIKHLKTIRYDDPSAKSIVFSNWKSALKLLQYALAKHSIGFVKMESPKDRQNAAQQFCDNPDVQVFLLHSSNESSGLNLTIAKNVFLVEPLLHSSLELQAVGRVARIGQEQNTNVYQYFVRDTVDERIVDLAHRKKRSLFVKEGERERNQVLEGKNFVDDIAENTALKGKVIEESADVDDMAEVLFEPTELKYIQSLLLQGSRNLNDANDNAHREGEDEDEEEVAANGTISAEGVEETVDKEARRLRLANAAEARIRSNALTS